MGSQSDAHQPPPLAFLGVAQSRTSDGRKIDTWSVRIPGFPSCEFDVKLHVTREQTWFEAVTTHQGLRHLSGMRETDLNKLRSSLDRALREYAEELLGEDWRPSLVVEAGAQRMKRHVTNSAQASRGVEIFFSVEDIRAASKQPDRNLPLRKVLRGETVMNVLERGRLDDFPKGEGLGEQARWSNERLRPVGRSLLPDTGDTRNHLDEIAAALLAFGEVLADRISPGGIQAGLPCAADLPEMMCEALRRAELPGPERDDVAQEWF